MFISLPFGTSLTFFLVLLSAVLIAVAFCHLATKPFHRCSASNIAAYHSRLDLELPFLLWSCRRHIHLAAKDVFVVTTGRRPIFFVVVVILLVTFMPSCCSYCHCSTGSKSHTVVLSKPASYSLVLCPRNNTRTRLPILYYGCVRYGESTAVVQLQYVSGCSKSMIKVWRKYAESKAYVRLKYSISTVKYGKSTVLYGNFFLAPMYCMYMVAAQQTCSSGQNKVPIYFVAEIQEFNGKVVANWATHNSPTERLLKQLTAIFLNGFILLSHTRLQQFKLEFPSMRMQLLPRPIS